MSMKIRELGKNVCYVRLESARYKKLSIITNDGRKIKFDDFAAFENFTKTIYAAYKKNKYVFEKGEK